MRRRRSGRFVEGALTGVAVLVLAPLPALAQRVNENAVTSAEDAFGAQVGSEKIGIYNDQDVRGFSPSKAGNMRIEGVYYDQVSQSSGRWRLNAAIRVGAAALDYPFPAPSGIVDYKVRNSGDKFAASAAVGRDPWGAPLAEVDFQVPIIKERLSFGAGYAYLNMEQTDGSSQEFHAMALIPRLRFSNGDALGIVSYVVDDHIMARPNITAADAFLPPIPKARRYLGQRWTEGHTDQVALMGITRFTLGDSWSVRAGLSSSQNLKSSNYTEVFSINNPEGAGRHRVISDPRLFQRSISGEAQLAWKREQGGVRHRVMFMIRGRNRLTESGGSDIRDLGPVILGQYDHEPKPVLAFGPVDKGRIRQKTFGVGYFGGLAGVGQINLGLQKTDYRQSFRHLGGLAQTETRPWLYNGALALTPRRWLTVYATYVRGLEESGAAPENAANRNEQLDASRTTQIDGGVRIAHGKTRFVASVFQLEKPYFTFDAANVFTEQGQVRHRGVEFSLSQDIGALHLLAGAVLMDPVVTGDARTAGRVGKRPVNTTPLLVRIDADLKTPVRGLSLSGAVVETAPRIASARTYAALGGEQLKIGATTVVDVGLRYRWKTGQTPMSLRVLLANAFDDKSWKVIAANTYQQADARRLSVGLAADF